MRISVANAPYSREKPAVSSWKNKAATITRKLIARINICLRSRDVRNVWLNETGVSSQAIASPTTIASVYVPGRKAGEKSITRGKRLSENGHSKMSLRNFRQNVAGPLISDCVLNGLENRFAGQPCVPLSPGERSREAGTPKCFKNDFRDTLHREKNEHVLEFSCSHRQRDAFAASTRGHPMFHSERHFNSGNLQESAL